MRWFQRLDFVGTLLASWSSGKGRCIQHFSQFTCLCTCPSEAREKSTLPGYSSTLRTRGSGRSWPSGPCQQQQVVKQLCYHSNTEHVQNTASRHQVQRAASQKVYVAHATCITMHATELLTQSCNAHSLISARLSVSNRALCCHIPCLCHQALTTATSAPMHTRSQAYHTHSIGVAAMHAQVTLHRSESPGSIRPQRLLAYACWDACGTCD